MKCGWLLELERIFRYLSAHLIAVSQVPQKSLALPMFHALTARDTVSGFVVHGNKTAWSTWNAFPELTYALVELAHVPAEVTEQIMKVIERFIVLVYNRTSTCAEVDMPGKRCVPKHRLC